MRWHKIEFLITQKCEGLFSTIEKKTHETLNCLFCCCCGWFLLFEIYKAERNESQNSRGVRISQMAVMLIWRSPSEVSALKYFQKEEPGRKFISGTDSFTSYKQVLKVLVLKMILKNKQVKAPFLLNRIFFHG